MKMMTDADALNSVGGNFWEGFACGASIGAAILTPYTGISVVAAIGSCGPLIWDGN